jgi:hypothetical protein
MNPYLINFPKIGNPSMGYVSISEGVNLPIKVNRVYWTYFTPEDVARGGHAHKQLEQVLIAVSGTIIIHTETKTDSNRFILSSPSQGLYIPAGCWRTMKYTHNAIQVCLASMEYRESDYIRSYQEFKDAI